MLEKLDDYAKWRFEASGVYMQYSSIAENRMSVRASLKNLVLMDENLDALHERKIIRRKVGLLRLKSH